MKKILLIGRNGFIGRNMHENLVSSYEVIAPNKEELNALDEQQVLKCLNETKPDIVINAADVNSIVSSYLEDRLRIYMNFAKYGDLFGKMIFFGSGAEYGRTVPISMISEDQFDRIIPKDTYGFCLSQMSKDAILSKNIYNLRLFGIFGKYEVWSKRFISNSICKAICGYPITIRRNTLFDYLYIDDLVDIVRWVIENEPQHHIYNAVSNHPIQLKEIADIINSKMGESAVPIYVADQQPGSEYTASNQRLLSEMKGFQPEPIEESISKLISYYRAHIDEISKEKLLYNERQENDYE